MTQLPPPHHRIETSARVTAWLDCHRPPGIVNVTPWLEADRRAWLTKITVNTS